MIRDCVVNEISILATNFSNSGGLEDLIKLTDKLTELDVNGTPEETELAQFLAKSIAGQFKTGFKSESEKDQAFTMRGFDEELDQSLTQMERLAVIGEVNLHDQ